MTNFTDIIKDYNDIESPKVFYHGSSKSVVGALANKRMEVNQTFFVTDDPMVAASYAGSNGSVLVIVTDTESGKQSRISKCINEHVNGSNQWVMSADEANQMMDDAEHVDTVAVWAVRKVMA